MTFPATASSPVADPIAEEALPASEVIIDANAADPSPVDPEDAKELPSFADVVKSAVAKPEEAAVSSDPVGDPVADPAAEAEADPAEAKAEDDADLPFHNHPRWKAVIAERDTLRDPAERYGKITSFMQEHGLSTEQVAEGYEIMALLASNDPVKLADAREWFAERLTALDGLLGHVLPDDLQEKVEEGLLDAEGAQEIAQARAAAKLREVKDTATAEANAQATAATEAAARTTSMVSAVEAWEAKTKASDPDYAKKARLMQDRCRSIVAETGKPPMTPEEATALAQRAHAEITAEMTSALPKPRAVTPVPASQSTVTSAAPKSLREAINAAVSG